MMLRKTALLFAALVAVAGTCSAAVTPKAGEEAQICVKDGKICAVKTLTPGPAETEVLFASFCTVALFTTRNAGEKMWVPNKAFIKEGSKCE